LRRFQPSISGVLAALALFLVLAGGGAYAADNYLIASTHQISPNVLNTLHGPKGKPGPRGPRGFVGATGATGAAGVAGTPGQPGPQGQQGAQGAQGAAGANGQRGFTGPQGATGPQGQQGNTGPQGDPGSQGPQGDTGPQGASGVNDPLVYSYSGSTGPDSGDCGQDWATDTYDRTFIVTANDNGSYSVLETFKGTFVTLAGVPTPASKDCSSTAQVGGITGTFYGTEQFNVAAVAAPTADFDPFADCGSACSPDTADTSNSSADAGNDAFVSAFFPGATTPSVANYDFVYTTPSDSTGNPATWVDSSTENNNNGDING
jgi:hypothetical protein